MRVKINILNHAKGLDLPYYATDASAGMDLRAAIDHETILFPGSHLLVATGLELELPIGFEAQIRPRSGLAFKNMITVLNAPGTIDADYRGEIMVMLVNHGREPFIITRGMRIAQMVIAKHERIEWEVTQELKETERGKGGFGSTGVK